MDGCNRFISPAYFIPERFKLGAVCLLPHPIGGRPRDTAVLGHNAGGAAVWIACEPPEVTRGYKLVVDGTVPVGSDDVTGMEQRHTPTSAQVPASVLGLGWGAYACALHRPSGATAGGRAIHTVVDPGYQHAERFEMWGFVCLFVCLCVCFVVF